MAQLVKHHASEDEKYKRNAGRCGRYAVSLNPVGHQYEENEEQESGVYVYIDSCQPSYLPGPTHNTTSAPAAHNASHGCAIGTLTLPVRLLQVGNPWQIPAACHGVCHFRVDLRPVQPLEFSLISVWLKPGKTRLALGRFLEANRAFRARGIGACVDHQYRVRNRQRERQQQEKGSTSLSGNLCA